MDSDASIDEKLLSLISEAVRSKFRKTKITPETNLRTGLGLDSLALLAVVFRLEQVFGIDIAKTNYTVNPAEMQTVGDAIRVAKELLQRAEALKNA